MKPLNFKLRGGAIATVIVVSALLMLVILGVITVWNGELFLFQRLQFISAQRDNINSAFVLYENHPKSIDEGIKSLFDSIPSKIRLEKKDWGLYRIVTITAVESGLKQIRMMGQRNELDYTLYYPSHNGILNLSGNTNIIGSIRVPKNGVAYTQMDSEVFSGKHLRSTQFAASNDSIIMPIAEQQIKRLFSHKSVNNISTSRLTNSFADSTIIYNCKTNLLALCRIHGNLLLLADRIFIDNSCDLRDIIIVGNHITVGTGFKGALQLFAKDSLIVQEHVELDYPSGAYSKNYIELNDNSSIDGYAIVESSKKKLRKMLYNYKQAVTAKVRGLLYVKGIAQLQGIVNGVAIVDRVNYYAPRNRYINQIHHATLIGSSLTALPFWIDRENATQTIKWVE